MRSLPPLAALLAVVLLSGCASKAEPVSICPKTGFIDNTDRVAYLAPGTKNIAAVAAIKRFSGECSFKDKHSNVVDVSLSLPFVAGKGPAGDALKSQELPYFIAVLSPDEQILQRKAFTTTIIFDNTGAGNNTEEHIIKIPLKNRDDADKYKIIIGFSLTRDQLKYNEEPHQ